MSDPRIIWARQSFGDLYEGSHEEHPEEVSIFLAGPTPRWPTNVPSWRPEAIRILREELKFEGWILAPELENESMGAKEFEYTAQIEWEDQGLGLATVIAFWMPRELKDMPGFTSNVEFGMYINSGKIVLGYPMAAAKMKYLQYHADQRDVPTAGTLYETMSLAVEMVGEILNYEETPK